jgi:hypothetical protein
VDGTTVVTSKDLGMVVGHRRQGVYGQRYVEGGSPERKAAFHGRWEEEADLVAMGPRHVNRVDGRWLQPEPLLMMGIPQASLRDPRSLAPYRYARNVPTVLNDRTGYDPDGHLLSGVYEYLAQVFLDPSSQAGDPVEMRRSIMRGQAQYMHLATEQVVQETAADQVFEGASAFGVGAVLDSIAAGVRRLVDDFVGTPRTPGAVPNAPNVPRAEPTPGGNAPEAAGHKKNARPSTQEKHETGDTRRKRDQGGEKGDDRRRPPSKPPPGHRGPWPLPPEPKK